MPTRASLRGVRSISSTEHMLRFRDGLTPVAIACRASDGRLLPQPVQVAAQEQGGDAAADAGAVAIPAVAGRSEGAH